MADQKHLTRPASAEPIPSPTSDPRQGRRSADAHRDQRSADAHRDQRSTDALRDWFDAAAVLARWDHRARESQYAHYEAAKALESLKYGLGIPVTVLSTLVGTTIYATLQKKVDLAWQIVLGSISVLAAILAGLQTFLRFGERAEKHRSCAAAYGEVRRSIERMTGTPLRSRSPVHEYLKQIEKKLNDLGRAAPNVSDRIFARGLRKMEETSRRHHAGKHGAETRGHFPDENAAHNASIIEEDAGSPPSDPHT